MLVEEEIIVDVTVVTVVDVVGFWEIIFVCD